MTEAEQAKKAAKAAYHREWRKKNPEKWKAITNRYWQKKTAQMIEQGLIPPPPTWIVSEDGKWEHCSRCGVAVEIKSMLKCKASESNNFNYCPNCGVQMEGDES